MATSKNVHCQITNKSIPMSQAVQGDTIRPVILEMIKKEHPDFDVDGYVSLKALNELRVRHVREMLEDDLGELSNLENEVLESVTKHDLVSKNIEEEFEEKESLGQRMADKIAEFGGSWKFIIIFATVLVVWMIINVIFLRKHAFDPYPFILLNLVLSCLAAIQAPIIMMSQNRMEHKDRNRAENDYQVNLKAELEIRQLHEKIDHLMTKQMEHLNDIQQIQIDLLSEISQSGEKK